MSSGRPKLSLDEQSFQDMLAAAFTIQEHNERRRKLARPAERACTRCGAKIRSDGPLCERCRHDEEARPGEELQRKWASLWLMSQEQGLFPDRGPSAAEAPPPAHSRDNGVSRPPSAPALVDRPDAEAPAPTQAVNDHVLARHTLGDQIRHHPILRGALAGSEVDEIDAEGLAEKLRILPDGPEPEPEATPDAEPGTLPRTWSLATRDELDDVAGGENQPPEVPPTEETLRRPWYGAMDSLRVRLTFYRGDLYMVLAIVVAMVAMGWVLSETPNPGARHKPRLRPWERALVAMGLAEPPEAPKSRGNPAASVWVDPKTALYYCAGEELYGKAPGGHAATQREAQLDSFQPASQAPCE